MSAARLIKDLGVDNMRISGVFSSDGSHYFDDFRSEAMNLSAEAELLSDKTFKVHNRYSEKVAELEEGNPDYDFCGYQYITTYLGATLDLYRCCIYAYNQRGFLGSLKNARLRDVWFSEEVKKNLADLDPRQCIRCQFNDRNRSINRMLKKPVHVEFV